MAETILQKRVLDYFRGVDQEDLALIFTTLCEDCLFSVETHGIVLKGHQEISGMFQRLWFKHEWVRHDQFSLVENAPVEKNSGAAVIERISHFRETFFETPFEVINIPNPNNSAYTSLGLRNHLDLPYYEIPPGYQFLHCLVNDATGGDSTAIDGFKVAEHMKKEFPEFFDVLTGVPVKFVNRDYTQNTTRILHAPLILLDKDNDFNLIRFSIAYMSIMDCAPNKMDLFYRAYRKFAELLHDDYFTVKFRLKAGDIFSFNNLRLLHGRTEFDPNSGHRHLQGYYMDRDEIKGRLNYLEQKQV